MKLILSLALVAACVLLAACSTANAVCKASHGSNPFVGRPFGEADDAGYTAFGCGLRQRIENGDGVIQIDATGGLQHLYRQGQSAGFATEFEVSYEWRRRQ